jgi:hypothetical protein
MIPVVVATTLVSDAASKIVSSVIGSAAGDVARAPIASRTRTRSPCPTRTTAPGSCWAAMASSTWVRTRLASVVPALAAPRS